MSFKLYLLGDKMAKFYKEAIKEYKKLLGRYCKIQLIEVKNQATLSETLPPNSYKIWIPSKSESISS